MVRPKAAVPKSLYFIGIKGVAMSALAVMAKSLGYQVWGSDVAENFPTDKILTKHKIVVYEGFKADNLKNNKPELVVISAAYGSQNPEVKAAKSLRLKTITQSELLGQLMAGFEGIGVAGVHGKTTTASMLSYILATAGFSPSYAIGAGNIPGLEGNGHIGEGQYFVAEADEYRKSEGSSEPKFLDLPLKHVIITSIELDHPDFYDTAEAVYQNFYRLATKIPRNGTLVACTDWPLVRRLVNRYVDRSFETYGFNQGAKWQIIDCREGERTIFSLKSNDRTLGPFVLELPGRYNVLNATAAIILALGLGVGEVSIIKSLRQFQGPERRFQYLGEINGAKVYDDFAHHPTAVGNLIEGVRKRFPGQRLVAVFQPHTYSRTGRLLKEFAQSLALADKIVLLNIYASSREKSGYVSIRDLITEVQKLKPDVEYRSSLDEVATFLGNSLTSHDVVLLIGAGDVYKIYAKIQQQRKNS